MCPAVGQTERMVGMKITISSAMRARDVSRAAETEEPSTRQGHQALPRSASPGPSPASDPWSPGEAGDPARFSPAEAEKKAPASAGPGGSGTGAAPAQPRRARQRSRRRAR
jgi:hypothetical protein